MRPAWCALTLPVPLHSAQKTGLEPGRHPEPTQSGQALLADTCHSKELLSILSCVNACCSAWEESKAGMNQLSIGIPSSPFCTEG